ASELPRSMSLTAGPAELLGRTQEQGTVGAELALQEQRRDRLDDMRSASLLGRIREERQRLAEIPGRSDRGVAPQRYERSSFERARESARRRYLANAGCGRGASASGRVPRD